MHLFLTSHIGGHLHIQDEIFPEMLLEENGFLGQLKALWNPNFRCLMIANHPDEIAQNDVHSQVFQQSFIMSGLPFSRWDILDDRASDISREELHAYDFILLLGGHVPTQHAFLERIGLKDKLSGYHGIIAGISAGTMNCARIVYSIPELEGEAIDPDYQRFFPGLGLTNIQVIPHYQWLKQVRVDGKRMIEDLAIPDSIGNRFVLLPDGCFILQHDGKATIFGEGYLLENGKIQQIGWPNEAHTLE
ncbi:MAG: Type 1 glutamine amidotransferase-like domain-containing protein [Clostridia bacterium]|nr:Type 1 glutamine amidotransferase-like domain-containing protein [Clostridia bacterium]